MLTSSISITASDEAVYEFESLFRAYYGRLARFLYRITGDTGRAEEVASETFWRLHQKYPLKHDNIEGWLYRTGVRLALDQLKKERRRSRYEARVSPAHAPANPEEKVEDARRRNQIRQTLGTLKPEQVALLLLRGEGFRYAEIASALNINANSVGTLLSRAESAFRKEYIKRYGQVSLD